MGGISNFKSDLEEKLRIWSDSWILNDFCTVEA